MRSLVLAVTISALAASWIFTLPAPAAAHFGSSAYIVVTADQVLPGQEFEVVAADLTPGASVSFRLVHEELSVPLTTTTAPPDGHFRLNMAVPNDFPSGDYAQLFALAGDGTEVSTWVLVGTRTANTPPRPGTGPWWSDPSVIVLGLIIAGAVGAVGWMLLRRRSSVSSARKRRPNR
jgi:hypothetical protein